MYVLGVSRGFAEILTIVGASVGGGVFLIIVISIIVCLCRKKNADPVCNGSASYFNDNNIGKTACNEPIYTEMNEVFENPYI